MKKSTMELMELLKTTKNISQFMDSVEDELIPEQNAGEYLNEAMEKRHLKKSEVIRKSGLDRGYAYDILSGKKEPSRDKVLALCIAMELDVEEVQTLLKSTGYPILYARVERDSIILFALQNKLPLNDINELLYEMGHGCIA